MAASDGIAVVIAVAAAQMLRFGADDTDLNVLGVMVPYWALGLALAVLWWLALSWYDSREVRLIGDGVEQAKRVISATTALYGIVAIVSYIADLPTARGYVVFALPLGLLGILVGRWLVRRKLIAERLAGLSSASVMIVGDVASAAHLSTTLSGNPTIGLKPAGIIVNGREDSGQEIYASREIPVRCIVPNVENVLASLNDLGADTLVLGSGSGLAPQELRELGWALADRRIRLIVAPGLSEIAGPRIHAHPLAGLPLVHVATPQMGTGRLLVKRMVDVAASGILLILLAPILLGLIVIVRVNDGGSAIFRQKRVGLQGKVFTMLKFRTMVPDAEKRLAELSAENNLNADGIMFKLAADPRVTRVGRWLRKSSLDELPQLINVLRGDMSLVGPRPQLLSEVEKYRGSMYRRLLVKPGITGLWQVSGRSDLDHDESIRLDLYYVENWSMAQDVAILIRTVGAVFGRHGAY